MRAQQADLRERRADQDRLVLVEPCIKESERPRHELVRAGVRQGGMSGRLCTVLQTCAPGAAAAGPEPSENPSAAEPAVVEVLAAHAGLAAEPSKPPRRLPSPGSVRGGACGRHMTAGRRGRHQREAGICPQGAEEGVEAGVEALVAVVGPDVRAVGGQGGEAAGGQGAEERVQFLPGRGVAEALLGGGGGIAEGEADGVVGLGSS